MIKYVRSDYKEMRKIKKPPTDVIDGLIFFYKAKAVEANEWYPIITPFSFKAFSSLEIEVYISPLYPTDDNFWQKKKAYSSITFILAGKTTLDKPESSNAFCVIN